MESLMPMFVFLLLLAIFVAALAWSIRDSPTVHTHRFPSEIGASLASKYPHLSARERVEIVEGLRDVFLISRNVFLISRKHPTALALPSRAVADAWHAFCGDGCYRKCFYLGGPCAAVREGFFAEGDRSDALCATWRLCCKLEGIDQHFPERLPRLFALDARLAIPGGSRYSIEADNHPPGDPLSPSALIDAIKRRLDPVDTVDARRRAIAMLARRVRVSLALESYPHDWGNRDLANLFNTISAHDDLLVATFGDVAMADVELARAKATPREPDPGCSCSAQSVDSAGGAGSWR